MCQSLKPLYVGIWINCIHLFSLVTYIVKALSYIQGKQLLQTQSYSGIIFNLRVKKNLWVLLNNQKECLFLFKYHLFYR